jgi:hypothetical protein
MPFGQSFWIGRLIGGAVEMVTGDEEAGQVARTISSLTIGLVTLDLAGLVGDALVDHLTEEGINTLADGATDRLSDHATSQVSEQGMHHALNTDPSFGSKQALRHAASIVAEAVADDPKVVAQQFLEHTHLPPGWDEKLMAVIDQSPARIEKVLGQFQEDYPAQFSNLKAVVSFTGRNA